MQLKFPVFKEKFFIQSVVVILFCISLLFAWFNLQVNALKWMVDEYHTLYLSSQHMFGGVYVSHNFGGTRFLLKILTPFSLFYMVNRMGGEHEITGWDYPGWFYIQKNLKSDGSGFSTDPNIQDFVFMQRFLFVAVVLGALFFVFYALWRRYNFYSALIYALGLILFEPLLSEMKYVYSNLFQLGAFALLTGLIINKNSLGRKDYLLFGAVLGLIASIKIEGVFLATACFLFLIYTNGNLTNRRLQTAGVSILTFAGLNVSELRFPNAFLHYTFANVYHYKTGHTVTEPSGDYQVIRIIETIKNPSIVLISVILLYLFFRRKVVICREEFRFLLLLSGLAMGLIFLLQDQRFFLARNLLTLGFVISVISSVLFGITLKEWGANKGNRIVSVSLAVIAFVLFFHVKSNHAFVTIQDLRECKKVGVISEKLSFFETEKIESIPETFIFMNEEKMFIDRLTGFDCILASWSENDKTYTHYILPKIFVLEKRLGNDFFFKKL